MVDAEGNAADDILLVVHVENDHLPLFELSTVGGVDPAEWEGEEQVWPGATVTGPAAYPIWTAWPTLSCLIAKATRPGLVRRNSGGW